MRTPTDTPPPGVAPKLIDVVILGGDLLARHTGLQIRAEQSHRRVLGYIVFPHETVDARLDAPVLGTTSELERLLSELALDEVYIAGNARREGEAMQEAVHVCERLGIPFALPASEFRFDRARPAHPEAMSDGYVHYLSVEQKPRQLLVKRLFDIAVSNVVLALLAPLFLVVALLVKLTSRGPVLYEQERVGRHGRHFNMLKFRSMVENADALRAGLLARNEQSGPVFKIARDPRITTIGRFLRRYSLDELPQFINVLRGEMSIVGPRPPLPSEIAGYEGWQRRRLSVAPGITCVWQVSGRNQISFEEWMYLDMQYIDHWSLAKDLKLILRTLPAGIHPPDRTQTAPCTLPQNLPRAQPLAPARRQRDGHANDGDVACGASGTTPVDGARGATRDRGVEGEWRDGVGVRAAQGSPAAEGLRLVPASGLGACEGGRARGAGDVGAGVRSGDRESGAVVEHGRRGHGVHA